MIFAVHLAWCDWKWSFFHYSNKSLGFNDHVSYVHMSIQNAGMNWKLPDIQDVIPQIKCDHWWIKQTLSHSCHFLTSHSVLLSSPKIKSSTHLSSTIFISALEMLVNISKLEWSASLLKISAVFKLQQITFFSPTDYTLHNRLHAYIKQASPKCW